MEDRFGRRVRVRGGDGSPPDRAGGVRPYVPSNLKPRVARHTPGSPAGDKENGGSPGHTSWAGQLWKHYDPINKIIFPGVGAKPTYDDRGARRAPRPTRPNEHHPASREAVSRSHPRREGTRRVQVASSRRIFLSSKVFPSTLLARAASARSDPRNRP